MRLDVEVGSLPEGLSLLSRMLMETEVFVSFHIMRMNSVSFRAKSDP